MKRLLNYTIILPILFLGLFITSCNTGFDGRYKKNGEFLMGSGPNGSTVYSELYIHEDGTYTYEVEYVDFKTGETLSEGKDEGTWRLDTVDWNGNQVTEIEYLEDPDEYIIWFFYGVDGGKRNRYELMKEDNWYPELWTSSGGKKVYHKTYLGF